MEKNCDLSISSFDIVFNNQILQLNYDSSLEEYKNQTINSVIEEVLNKIGPKPFKKTSKDYILLCSCGRQYNPKKLLFKAKCPHFSESNFNKDKNKNEKFVLYEKEKEEKYEKYLSSYEIGKIIMKVTGAKSINNISGIIPNEDKGNFPISDNLKNKIIELYLKKERGNLISLNSYELKYNEEIYNELLVFGIPNNKIKAALRMSGNNKEEALLLATDETFNWENKEYLYYENNEIISSFEFKSLCFEGIKKEFPLIDDENEILNRMEIVIDKIKNIILRNGDSEDSESEINEEQKESSSEDIEFDSDSINI